MIVGTSVKSAFDISSKLSLVDYIYIYILIPCLCIYHGHLAVMNITKLTFKAVDKTKNFSLLTSAAFKPVGQPYISFALHQFIIFTYFE